jgi:hypothetical protein
VMANLQLPRAAVAQGRSHGMEHPGARIVGTKSAVRMLAGNSSTTSVR